MASMNQFPSVKELLKTMVSYDTVNSGISGRLKPEEPLVEFLQKLAESAGFETRRLAVPDQSDELLILYRCAEELPWVLFDSHIDTVSLDGMTVEPLGGIEKDGRIWGRGSCDTKGSGAAMFRALREYSEGEGQNNNIALLYSVDEERGMTGIQTFANTHYANIGFDVKGVIVGEPTQLKPVVAHNGLVRYTVQTHGIAAHSANPSLGKSAISDMARLVIFLEEEFIPTCLSTHPLTGKAQCSINVIRGGTAANIIPDKCEIQIDRRVVPGESQSEAVHGIDGAMSEFQKRFPESKVTWQQSVDTPALNDAVKTGFADNVLHILSSLGLPGEGTGATYGTHAGDLQAAGFAAVVLGPGDIAQAHTKDEWIDTTELERSVEVYKQLMAGL